MPTDYAGEAQAHPDVEIVAAWDEDPTRGADGAADLGVPFHADLAELLARPDVDGVIVTTRTTAHRDVIIAAAEAGKHVFTEKVAGADADRGARDRRRRPSAGRSSWSSRCRGCRMDTRSPSGRSSGPVGWAR